MICNSSSRNTSYRSNSLLDDHDDVLNDVLWRSHDPTDVRLPQDNTNKVLADVRNRFGEAVPHFRVSVVDKIFTLGSSF